MPHAAQHLHLVLLYLHAPAAPVALLPPLQLPVNLLNLNGHTRRQALYDGYKRSPMRLSGGGEAKHKKAVTRDK
jgi:hypothetical protein